MGLLAVSGWVHLLFEIAISLLSIFLILIVLVQRGRGGGLAGALGGMGGQSAFGTRAGDTFTWITYGAALIWILLAAITIKTFTNPAADRAAAKQAELAQEMEAFTEEDAEAKRRGPEEEGAAAPTVGGDAAEPAKSDDAAKTEEAKAEPAITDDAAKTDAPKTDAPKTDAPKAEAPATPEPAAKEAPKSEPLPKEEAKADEPAPAEAPKSESTETEPKADEGSK